MTRLLLDASQRTHNFTFGLQDLQDEVAKESEELQRLQSQRLKVQEALEELDQQKTSLEEQLTHIRQQTSQETQLVEVSVYSSPINVTTGEL